MDWHTISANELIKDANSFEQKSLTEIGLIEEIAARYRTTYFAHIFSGGYSSGYYSYVHAAVLDSDGFEAFKEKMLLKPLVGARFLSEDKKVIESRFGP